MTASGWTTEESINWDDVNDDGPAPLDNGIYALKVLKASPEKTKTQGDPAIKLELEAIEMIGQGELERPRKVFDNVTFINSTAFRVKRLAKSADIEAPPSNGFGAVSEFCERLVDAGVVYARLRQNEYQGKINARVDTYLTQEAAAEAAALLSVAAEAPQRRRTA